MERAAAGSRAARRTGAFDADRQADQCRFSQFRLDAAGQHHDARAGSAGDAIGAAHTGTGRERAIAVAAPDINHIDAARAGVGQKAARAEIGACVRAGPTRTHGTGSRDRASSRGVGRLTLSKAAADR